MDMIKSPESLSLEINEIENSNEANHSVLEEKKTALENLRKEKLQGHFIRSRAKWVDEGEKPTKYFCHLESRNYLNKTKKTKNFIRRKKLI